jgi:hypothetical protein
MLLNLECLHMNPLIARWIHDREIARVVIRLEQDTSLTLLPWSMIFKGVTVHGGSNVFLIPPHIVNYPPCMIEVKGAHYGVLLHRI